MGSKIGWIVAGVLVVALAVTLIVVLGVSSHSAPSGKALRAGMLDKQAVEAPITLVLPAQPSGAGNAGDDYKQALDIVHASEAQLTASEEALAGGQAPSQASLDVLDRIAKSCASAAGKATMEFTIPYGSKLPEVHWDQPAAADLSRLRGPLYQLAVYQGTIRKDYPEAQKALLSYLALGYHMTNERVYPVMVATGLDTQNAACDELKKLYKTWGGEHVKQCEQIEQYQLALGKMSEFIANKMDLVWSTKPNPGDVFFIIERDQDPSWHNQGILALGLVKFTADNRDDVKYALNLIDKFLAKGNPVEKAAAQAARDFTQQQLQNR